MGYSLSVPFLCKEPGQRLIDECGGARIEEEALDRSVLRVYALLKFSVPNNEDQQCPKLIFKLLNLEPGIPTSLVGRFFIHPSDGQWFFVFLVAIAIARGTFVSRYQRRPWGKVV